MPGKHFHIFHLDNYCNQACLIYRLKKFEVMMVLSSNQFYCVSLRNLSNIIQLDVILDKNTEASATHRRLLVEFFHSTLEQIRKEIMPAAAKPIRFVPCPHCSQLHIKYDNLFKGGVQLCKTKSIPKDHYQDLFKNIQGTYVHMSV